ncbi:MAG: tripartite tricarboxylate transporter permease [candidate division Zixibacteria bacterium]|nr:tripartite tricarboxylate transporter permease [candidate division Zixibacteria bacterium]
MDILQQLSLGFRVVLDPVNFLLCFIGVLLGTLVGVLPGLGPTASISLLLPISYKINPAGAIIMLSGIYYGAMYGGSTTSILVNIPGEAASVVTCLDGYQMARQGRAGPALGIAAFGSFIAGTVGIVGLMLLAPPLVKIALKFGPPEYFSLMVLGIMMVVYLASGSIIKALMMATFGFLLSSIGQDIFTGSLRFSWGIYELSDGIGIVPVAMGLFGISEVLINLEMKLTKQDVYKEKISGLLPTLQDWMEAKWAIARGTIIGFFLGILPGGGAMISSFVSYAIEKKLSKHPEKFGKGAIEGVAGPESANNSACGGAFIPLLTLGIPANAVLAVLMGALMIHDIIPGPFLMEKHPDLFWGVICSMYIGNGMLLVLNLPLIGLWVKVLKIPYPILFPAILLICLIGAYSLNSTIVDVVIMIFFGIIGYLMKKFGYEAAPLILALVLGGMLEPALRRSLIMSGGSFKIFFTRPISLILLTVMAILLLSPLILKVMRKYRTVVVTDD